MRGNGGEVGLWGRRSMGGVGEVARILGSRLDQEEYWRLGDCGGCAILRG